MYRLSLIISEIYNKYLPLAEKEGIILNLDFSDTTKEITDPERVKSYLDEHLNNTLKRTDPTKKGEVTIGVNHEAVTITDTATTLSHTACALLSNRFIDVKSRLGFGTTVTIFLKPRAATSAPKDKPPVKISGLGVAANLDNNPAHPTLTTSARVSAQQGREHLNLNANLQLTGKSPAKPKTSSRSKSIPQKSRKSLLSGKSKSPTKSKAPSKSTTSASSKSSTRPKKHLLAKPKAKSMPKVKLSKTDRQLAIAARKADKEVKRIAKKASKQAKKSLTKTKRKPTKKLEIS